jgi:L-proline---[L-prolyl-carrier protein] ligase
MNASGLLHDVLRRCTELHPERIAVLDGPRCVRYNELEEESNRLAHVLTGDGVRPGDRVGLAVPKSADAVIGIYGILKSGAGYVPLDLQSPPHRLGSIIRNCGITCLVTTAATATRLADLLGAGSPVTSLVLLDGPGTGVRDAAWLDTAAAASTGRPPRMRLRVTDRAALRAQSASPPRQAGRDGDLAYVLHTSGSTGVPKGAAFSHRNALAFARWAASEFGLSPADRVASHAPFHFDLSVFDLFGAALAGAAVVLIPPPVAALPAEQARLIETARVSVWYSVPSALIAMMRRGGLATRDLSGLRAVLFAGEVFPAPQLRRLMELLRHTRFANLYGPTETNVCTWYEVPPLPAGQDEPIPIGRPVPGVQTFVVTGDGRPASTGEAGELYVQGPTVMRGYWGDAELTGTALVPSPGGEQGALAYRTGDLVRQAPDGNYHFLGRRDHQVKSRGYRIELGEVEAALHADPGVVACVAVAIPDNEFTNRLAACVVMRGTPAPERLARACSERLPRYMRPEWFVFYDALPLTSTGKVDRTALARDLVAHPPPRAAPGVLTSQKGGAGEQ